MNRDAGSGRCPALSRSRRLRTSRFHPSPLPIGRGSGSDSRSCSNAVDTCSSRSASYRRSRHQNLVPDSAQARSVDSSRRWLPPATPRLILAHSSRCNRSFCRDAQASRQPKARQEWRRKNSSLQLILHDRAARVQFHLKSSRNP
ncbi:MAG: hypothetical protein F6K11_30975 [Leptolyngbya sp. SIO3F4]|nr:hypothetical protein [Leptolyngbya sp. SIO3F4]